MPDSASGVSITRSSPKSLCRPSVIRKTPPSRPTSSPMMTTFGSFSRALRSDSLSALANGIWVMSVPLPGSGRVLEGGLVGGELSALLVDERVPVGVDVLEDRHGVGVRHVPHPFAHPLRQRVALGLDLGVERLVGQALLLQVRPQPLDGVLRRPLLAL